MSDADASMVLPATVALADARRYPIPPSTNGVNFGVFVCGNVVPFASARALHGLSKLAVWWLRLGIQLERITPGHPQQNGRHERMHLTLKREATSA